MRIIGTIQKPLRKCASWKLVWNYSWNWQCSFFVERKLSFQGKKRHFFLFFCSRFCIVSVLLSNANIIVIRRIKRLFVSHSHFVRIIGTNYDYAQISVNLFHFLSFYPMDSIQHTHVAIKSKVLEEWVGMRRLWGLELLQMQRFYIDFEDLKRFTAVSWSYFQVPNSSESAHDSNWVQWISISISW